MREVAVPGSRRPGNTSTCDPSAAITDSGVLTGLGVVAVDGPLGTLTR